MQWDDQRLGLGVTMLDIGRRRLVRHFNDLRDGFVKGANGDLLGSRMTEIYLDLRNYWEMEEMVMRSKEVSCSDGRVAAHVAEHHQISGKLDRLLKERRAGAIPNSTIIEFQRCIDRCIIEHFSTADQACRHNLRYY